MKSVLMLLFPMLLFCTVEAQKIYLNEIRANDAGTDDAEFIEIIGPAGSDISDWSITHINGVGGGEQFVFSFPSGTIIPEDGILDNSGQEVGFIVIKRTAHAVTNYDFEWGTTSLQNGPDGLILKNASGNRVQALTWNGLGDLSGGSPPWRNIGADDNDDNSLSAPDDIEESSQALWDYIPATPGILNGSQTSGDLSLPVHLTSFKAHPGNGKVTLRWITEAEVDNLGFIIERSLEKDGDYVELASYQTLDNLKGAGNSSQSRTYTFIDNSVFNDHVYWYRLIDVDMNGIHNINKPIAAIPTESTANIAVVDERSLSLPKQFILKPNYPNPFNPHTAIEFDLPENDNELHRVSLIVYNVLGQKILTLFSGNLPANSYQLKWNGINSFGKSVPSGVYLYILKTDDFYASNKMVLLK
jgi:hypothetical protein